MGLEVNVLFAGIPVSDFVAGVEFYQRLIGRPADIVVHESEVMWHVAEQGWLYVVAQPKEAGHALVTLAVTDLDATLADLARRDLTGASIEDIPGSGRKATLLDPDGNTVSLIEVAQSG